MSPWETWEDYTAGMYRGTLDLDRQADSARLLADPGGFTETAREMLREWPTAARQNLTNMWSGRNAWLGQAACCYAHGATAADTRAAWGTLTNAQQNAANAAARTVRFAWEKEQTDAQTFLVF
jgi:hypothetical protein